VSAIVALLAYGAGYESPPMPALVIGMIAYAISGIVIGVQTQRYRHQRQQLEQDATRDAITGSYRGDYFTARLREEVRRSARYDESFTLSLVRLIEFEDFQHLYGRVKADLLLERLAEVLHLTVRSTDLVGRLESALFAVMMPSTSAEEAHAVAERLVSAVAAAEFEGDALEPIVHCTAQVVSAAYPGDTTDADALMAAVRSRLDTQTSQPGEEPGGASSPSVPSLGDVPS
jgi:diguanylate cyclase (GGDEF)-like protein